MHASSSAASSSLFFTDDPLHNHSCASGVGVGVGEMKRRKSICSYLFTWLHPANQLSTSVWYSPLCQQPVIYHHKIICKRINIPRVTSYHTKPLFGEEGIRFDSWRNIYSVASLISCHSVNMYLNVKSFSQASKFWNPLILIGGLHFFQFNDQEN